MLATTALKLIKEWYRFGEKRHMLFATLIATVNGGACIPYVFCCSACSKLFSLACRHHVHVGSLEVDSWKLKSSLEISDGSINDQKTTTARSWVSSDRDSLVMSGMTDKWTGKPLGSVRHGLVIFMQSQRTDFHERERWLQRTFEAGYAVPKCSACLWTTRHCSWMQWMAKLISNCLKTNLFRFQFHSRHLSYQIFLSSVYLYSRRISRLSTCQFPM